MDYVSPLQLLCSVYAVMTKMDEWSTILWSDVVVNIDKMATEMEGFSSRCKKVGI